MMSQLPVYTGEEGATGRDVADAERHQRRARLVEGATFALQLWSTERVLRRSAC